MSEHQNPNQNPDQIRPYDPDWDDFSESGMNLKSSGEISDDKIYRRAEIVAADEAAEKARATEAARQAIDEAEPMPAAPAAPRRNSRRGTPAALPERPSLLHTSETASGAENPYIRLSERPNTGGASPTDTAPHQAYRVVLPEAPAASTPQPEAEPVTVEPTTPESQMTPEQLREEGRRRLAEPARQPGQPHSPRTEAALRAAGPIDMGTPVIRPEAQTPWTDTEGEEVRAPESTPAPEQQRTRGRHRRESPAGLLARVRGNKQPQNPDTTETQPIPVVTANSSETTASAPERPGRMRRLRAKLGAIAAALEDFGENFANDTELRNLGVMPSNNRGGVTPEMSKAERKLELRRTKIEEDFDSRSAWNVLGVGATPNRQPRLSVAERRRRLAAGLGLAAASAGLMLGVSGDIARDDAPRSSISANQLPGQQAERPSLADEARKAVEDAKERAREAAKDAADANQGGDKQETAKPETSNPKTVDVGNEKVSIGDDGSVTIELEKGGTYWDGVQEAERLLDIDDSSTATAEAVNTIGFEQNEDRKQKVGSKITFKNVNGKLVASRS